jgi:hypothetical protein
MKGGSDIHGETAGREGGPYLPGYSADIFISYSHNDDLPFGEEGSRWVTEFHRNLDIRVRAYLGRAAAIWRDPKLAGSDIFSDEIAIQLRGSGLLVSVVSPSYLRSDWCTRELQTFVEGAQQSGGIDIGNKKRIVKVIKTPVPRGELPQILDSILGHEFFRVEFGTDAAREFHLDPSPEARRAYWAKLDDVAQEVRVLIDSILKQGSITSQPQVAAQTVYLAITSSDLQNERDTLRRELQDRGYIVLPDHTMPWSGDQFAESVRSDLKRSQLSIHMLGSRYGIVLEGEQRSIVELQSDLATEQDLGRITWMPPDLSITDERQAAFVKALHSRSHPSDRFELLQTSLESLKTHVLDRLRESRSPTPLQSDNSGPARIYLVCERRDRAEVAPLRQHLLERGYEVILPLAKGEPDQVRQDHHENLLLCDAVLIYWGGADEFWLRSKVRDLARVRGLGRTGPFAASGVLIADPPSTEKEEFDTRDAMVIRGAVPASIEPFVAALSKKTHG